MKVSNNNGLSEVSGDLLYFLVNPSKFMSKWKALSEFIINTVVPTVLVSSSSFQTLIKCKSDVFLLLYNPTNSDFIIFQVWSIVLMI